MPVALAVVLAACGSSGSKSTSSAPRSSASTTASHPATNSTSSLSRAALITTKHDKLGTILAFGPQKLTVYLFEADHGSTSSCTGPCASAWPPVTGKPQATGGAVASLLGTITRPDGTAQVTYNGHPLYLFNKDKDDGDTYGQGVNQFGAGWYALAPSGNKIDTS
jgi:predicted lipoprotein with Yx(FWY)xxD motif